MRGLRRALIVGVVAGLLLGGSVAVPAQAVAGSGRRTITGDIDGARFRVELPDRWNGTLVLYSHGNYPNGFFPSFGIWLTNRAPDRSETEAWLLEHGYALAGSEMSDGGLGYHIERGLREGIALLDWFEANVGRPRRTIATGQSAGAGIALLLAERYPDRFAGVATVCGGNDPQGLYNVALDMTFAIRTLLAEPTDQIDLVRPRDPAASAQALADAVDAAVATREGRARLALAASFNNVTGWFFGHQPRPSTMEDRIRNQALWLKFAYSLSLGPTARPDIERRAGGNPSWNIGVDYERQLTRSSQAGLVEDAYREAGIDLSADLAALAAAPRIAPDPKAIAYMYRFGVPRGTIPVPTITMHTTGDGGAVPDQERWYAGLVDRHGDAGRLRQLYVDRGQHCSVSAAEEIVELRSLFRRIDTGRWPDLTPATLDAQVTALGPRHQLVLDFATFADTPEPPAFTRFTPPMHLRPSR